MRHTYDSATDLHYIYLQEPTDEKVSRTLSVDANVDLNNDGEIIGFEIFGIKHRVASV